VGEPVGPAVRPGGLSPGHDPVASTTRPGRNPSPAHISGATRPGVGHDPHRHAPSGIAGPGRYAEPPTSGFRSDRSKIHHFPRRVSRPPEPSSTAEPKAPWGPLSSVRGPNLCRMGRGHRDHKAGTPISLLVVR